MRQFNTEVKLQKKFFQKHPIKKRSYFAIHKKAIDKTMTINVLLLLNFVLPVHFKSIVEMERPKSDTTG